MMVLPLQFHHHGTSCGIGKIVDDVVEMLMRKREREKEGESGRASLGSRGLKEWRDTWLGARYRRTLEVMDDNHKHDKYHLISPFHRSTEQAKQCLIIQAPSWNSTTT